MKARRLRIALMVVLAAAGACAAGAACAQGTAAAPDGNTLAQLARAAGVQKCVPAAGAVNASMTGNGTEHGALIMTHPAAPDAAMFGASVERTTPRGPSLVSAWFAPTPRGNCDVAYDMVDVWPKACTDVAREIFGHAQPLAVVARSIGVIQLGPTHHVYLVATPGGCVSIRKEVIYP